jgi:hypothetical protein
MKKVAAIMQPTYLPWAGYFNIINQVDLFVFLDDAQYSKGSWHNRNRILNREKVIWSTIPLKKNLSKKKINEYVVSDCNNWKLDHSNLFKECYLTHPYFECVQEIINFLQLLSTDNLASINISIIKFICQKLNIDVSFEKSSINKFNGIRTDKLINILNFYNVTEYVSPQGSKDYLAEDKFLEKTRIKLNFNKFQSKPYTQFCSNNFYENLSILDVLANLGWSGTKAYINV